MSKENKDKGSTDSQKDGAWHLKEKRLLNSVQCHKHKLQESESNRNPDQIKQSEECDDNRKHSDKDEDKQPAEESRKKESKLTPLMKIEEKFRGRSFCLQAGYIQFSEIILDLQILRKNRPSLHSVSFNMNNYVLAFAKKKTKRVNSNPHLDSKNGKEDASAGQNYFCIRVSEVIPRTGVIP